MYFLLVDAFVNVAVFVRLFSNFFHYAIFIYSFLLFLKSIFSFSWEGVKRKSM